MRLEFGFRFIREPLPTLHAAEEPNPLGRWISTQVNLRTILEIAALGITLYATHNQNAAELVRMRADIDTSHADAAQLRVDVTDLRKTLADDYVKRTEISRAQHDRDAAVADLQTGQRELQTNFYSLLMQRGLSLAPLRLR